MFKLLLPSHFVMIVTYFLLGTKDEQSDIGNPIPAPRIIKRVPLISRWTFHFPQGTLLLYLPQPRPNLTHHGNCPTFHLERQLVFYQFYHFCTFLSFLNLAAQRLINSTFNLVLETHFLLYTGQNKYLLFLSIL